MGGFNIPLDIPLYWHAYYSRLPFASFRAMQTLFPETRVDTSDGPLCLYDIEYVKMPPDVEPDSWKITS